MDRSTLTAAFARWKKRKSVLSGLFIGIVLMFAGTNAWTTSLRYVTFLLPEQRLEIVAAQPEDDRLPKISVLWMSTSWEIFHMTRCSWMVGKGMGISLF